MIELLSPGLPCFLPSSKQQLAGRVRLWAQAKFVQCVMLSSFGTRVHDPCGHSLMSELLRQVATITTALLDYQLVPDLFLPQLDVFVF